MKTQNFTSRERTKKIIEIETTLFQMPRAAEGLKSEKEKNSQEVIGRCRSNLYSCVNIFDQFGLGELSVVSDLMLLPSCDR